MTAAAKARTLAQALLEFQQKAPALRKDSVNPHFKNKYVSLDHMLGEILPVLNECGLVVTQFPTVIEDVPALRTRITETSSGEYVEDTMPLLLVKADPQGLGSAITYARRYSLAAILALAADGDDDGNTASKRPEPPKAPPVASRKAPEPPREPFSYATKVPQSVTVKMTGEQRNEIESLIARVAVLRAVPVEKVTAALENDNGVIDQFDRDKAEAVLGKLRRWEANIAKAGEAK